MITHVRTMARDKLHVSGTTADNGEVRRVLVNGREAKAVTANFAQWEIVLDLPTGGLPRLEAFAEDTVGNREKRPHVITWK